VKSSSERLWVQEVKGAFGARLHERLVEMVEMVEIIGK